MATLGTVKWPLEDQGAPGGLRCRPKPALSAAEELLEDAWTVLPDILSHVAVEITKSASRGTTTFPPSLFIISVPGIHSSHLVIW